jgi:two-component system chemotaxis response regulator CheB
MRDAIVVGASAGGIRALEGLVGSLPADLAAGVAVVVHVPPDAQSALPSILDRAGPLPAKAAESGEPLERGTVYVAPPDRHLLIEDGRLRLTQGPRENRVRPCIDTLFRSAAVDLGPRVIGVVLSGTLDDGTAGLWAVKDRGGVAIAQQPDDAEYPDMPQSAIAHVAVDHVLRVADMGGRLAKLVLEAAAQAKRARPAAIMETALMNGAQTSNEGLPFGQLSPNTCPECHGSLVEIHEGTITRYRCHTGHGFTLRALLADTELAIEKSLWNAVRAIEERSFLLRTMRAGALEAGQPELAAELERAALRDEASAKHVRQLTTTARSDRAA